MRTVALEPEVVDKQKRSWKDVFWALALILGLLGMLYPVTSTLVNNRYHAIIAERTRAEAAQLPDHERDALWGAMLAYNRDITAHPVSELSIGGDHTSPEYRRYLGTGLAAGQDQLAQVIIPSVGIALPVYHGTSDGVLAKGAGHLFGTTFPTGGEGSNTAISAHTGLVNASMFDNLPKLEKGEDIYVHVLGRTLRYQMVGSKVVPPDSLDAIPLPGVPGDHLYLITCTPYGLNFNRLVVDAVRVPMDEQAPPGAETTNSIIGWQWWMWLSVGFALLVLLLLLIPLLRRRRKEEEDEDL